MAFQLTDRRRVNGPAGGTIPAVFSNDSPSKGRISPKASRQPNSIRKIFLRRGIVPSASGSAYLEFQQPEASGSPSTILERTPTVKISCAVHGPKPVPRSAPFSNNLLLNAHVKLAPFATRIRRGYVRDSAERDLAVHLETALRSIIIAERWPKSGVDIVITVLEGDEQLAAATGLNATFGPQSLGLMSMLSGCITAASVALIDAGIDCVDIVTGGVAALVPKPSSDASNEQEGQLQVVQDPVPSEHGDAVAACMVGYLRSRDELADVWMLCDSSGNLSSLQASDNLLEGAIQAAISSQRVVVDLLKAG